MDDSKIAIISFRTSAEARARLDMEAGKRGISLSRLMECYIGLLIESETGTVDKILFEVERIEKLQGEWLQRIVRAREVILKASEEYAALKENYIDKRAMATARQMVKAVGN